VDSGYPGWLASNCIHAVADLDRSAVRIRVASPSWGEVASHIVTRRFGKWIIDPDVTHDWLLAQLDLGDYPLIRRDFERPGVILPTLGPHGSCCMPRFCTAPP
jgi:hypothetical protein